MKKILLAAALCCGALTTHADNPLIDGSSYFLPKTALRFTLLVEKTTYKPGEFNQYAERYLKKPVHSEEQQTYRILSIKMTPYGVADTTKVFKANIDTKHNISSIYKNDNGVLLAVNDRPNATTQEAPFKAAPKPARRNPYDYLSQEILSAGSKSKMAELTAEEIYDIRDSRSQLTKGQAENMPTDGQQMRLMLNSLDKQEAALVELFNGTEDVDTIETIVNYVPTKTVERELLFRFSKYYGCVDKEDLSGSPYYIDIYDEHNVPTNSATVGKGEKIKNESGIWVNLPGKMTVNLYQGEKLLDSYETYSAQFGRTEPLMGELFSKKMETKVRLSPVTGNVDSINTEIKK